ncbi:TPA: hypothetical protein GDD11_03940 [Legionella pneumophila]|nr:hypothetical protein [Legionella pneumophila]HAT8331051.1 hypothetical protein [Legionella pneumophila]
MLSFPTAINRGALPNEATLSLDDETVQLAPLQMPTCMLTGSVRMNFRVQLCWLAKLIGRVQLGLARSILTEAGRPAGRKPERYLPEVFLTVKEADSFASV